MKCQMAITENDNKQLTSEKVFSGKKTFMYD